LALGSVWTELQHPDRCRQSDGWRIV